MRDTIQDLKEDEISNIDSNRKSNWINENKIFEELLCHLALRASIAEVATVSYEIPCTQRRSTDFLLCVG